MPSDTPLPSSFDGDSDFYEENRMQKLTRRLKEEPLIPLGCILTCMALLGATRSMRAGDHNRTNRMFRARIYAQGFTLAAMVAGSMYWQTDRQKRKEFDQTIAERKAKEKNEAWIRELEARDREDKEIRAKRDAWRKQQAAARSQQPPTSNADTSKIETDVEAWRRQQLADAGQIAKSNEKGASSMIDVKEMRMSTLEAVAELLYGRG